MEEQFKFGDKVVVWNVESRSERLDAYFIAKIDGEYQYIVVVSEKALSDIKSGDVVASAAYKNCHKANNMQIEDLDISEIVYDLETACKYLEIRRPSFYILDGACERSEKFEAQMELQLIREAWSKFDGFAVDWDDHDQAKHYPVLRSDESVKYYTLSNSKHISASCYSFPTPERALQFGTQFKELFKTAMGL